MKTEIKCPLCGDTMVKPKLSPGCWTHQHQTRCPFVWNDLTEEQMDVLRDAALGRAVRTFKDHQGIRKSGPYFVCQDYDGDYDECDTPKAALQAAGLWEVEK